MDDESKELVKAATEGAVAGATGEFLDKLLGPAVEIGDRIRDYVRFQRVKSQLKMLEKTLAILEERNIPATGVAWKVLFPLLEYSALEAEDDDEMLDRWAALLANASAGTSRGSTILPSFPRILSELSAEEAAILDVLYRDPDPAQVPSLYRRYPDDPDFAAEGDPLFYTRCFNLEALGLLQASWENVQMGDTIYQHKVSHLEGNALGLSFVLACKPPRP